MLAKAICFFALIYFCISVFANEPARKEALFTHTVIVKEIPSQAEIAKFAKLPEPKELQIEMAGVPTANELMRLNQIKSYVKINLTSYPTVDEVKRLNDLVRPRELAVTMSPPSPSEAVALNQLAAPSSFLLISPVYHYGYEVRTFNSLKIPKKIKFTRTFYPYDDEVDDLKMLTDTSATFINASWPTTLQTNLLKRLPFEIALQVDYYPTPAVIENFANFPNLKTIIINALHLPQTEDAVTLALLPANIELNLGNMLCSINNSSVEVLRQTSNLTGLRFRADSCLTQQTYDLLKKLPATVTFEHDYL